MKKAFYLLALTLVISCSPEEIYEPVMIIEIPKELEIEALEGIKLESNFATESILMNVKLNQTGDYYIKVLDNQNRLVSKEKVLGEIGDNIFKVYTSTLPKSSYRIELFHQSNKVGATSINLL